MEGEKAFEKPVPDDFVHRIVAADIFTQNNQASALVENRGGMKPAGLGKNPLRGLHSGGDPDEKLPAQPHWG